MILITGGTEWTNVPLLILSNKYSRQHETQADDYAVLKLKENGKDHHALADILERMAGSLPPEVDGIDILSTHPSFKERVSRIRSVRSN
ncbi:MAG: M48 family metalloprotease [Bdellovibrionaceae bacterium]|nr:M48 family metalloprotease [Pseudobdellovibrionaceae bacterium]